MASSTRWLRFGRRRRPWAKVNRPAATCTVETAQRERERESCVLVSVRRWMVRLRCPFCACTCVCPVPRSPVVSRSVSLSVCPVILCDPELSATFWSCAEMLCFRVGVRACALSWVEIFTFYVSCSRTLVVLSRSLLARARGVEQTVSVVERGAPKGGGSGSGAPRPTGHSGSPSL
jgi:hypothetical protein